MNKNTYHIHKDKSFKDIHINDQVPNEIFRITYNRLTKDFSKNGQL